MVRVKDEWPKSTKRQIGAEEIGRHSHSFNYTFFKKMTVYEAQFNMTPFLWDEIIVTSTSSLWGYSFCLLFFWHGQLM